MPLGVGTEYPSLSCLPVDARRSAERHARLVAAKRCSGRPQSTTTAEPGTLPPIRAVVDIPSVRAAELDAVLRSIDDRLELAAEGEREHLMRARAALERELSRLLLPLA
jgi:hypothetical protein